MLQIKSFSIGPLQVNNYLVYDETNEASLIDCGCYSEAEWAEIRNFINGKGLKLVHMLCTHLHFDHIMGCGFVRRDFGLDIEGSIDDIDQYSHRNLYSEAFGLKCTGIPDSPALTDISSLDTIKMGNHEFEIIQTPGHTLGGLCFYCKEDNVLFSGDTLFQASIGRTDLPGGNQQQIIRSIVNKLMTLPSETQVFTGHGPSTTIDFEKKYNPYI